MSKDLFSVSTTRGFDIDLLPGMHVQHKPGPRLGNQCVRESRARLYDGDDAAPPYRVRVGLQPGSGPILNHVHVSDRIRAGQRHPRFADPIAQPIADTWVRRGQLIDVGIGEHCPGAHIDRLLHLGFETSAGACHHHQINWRWQFGERRIASQPLDL